MNPFLTILALAAVAAVSLLPGPAAPRRLHLVLRSPKGAEQASSFQKIIPVPVTGTGIVARVVGWRYPTNIALTNYWWDLEGSTDLVHWATEQTNLGPGDASVGKSNSWRFFRMHGHK